MHATLNHVIKSRIASSFQNRSARPQTIIVIHSVTDLSDVTALVSATADTPQIVSVARIVIRRSRDGLFSASPALCMLLCCAKPRKSLNSLRLFPGPLGCPQVIHSGCGSSVKSREWRKTNLFLWSILQTKHKLEP